MNFRCADNRTRYTANGPQLLEPEGALVPRKTGWNDIANRRTAGTLARSKADSERPWHTREQNSYMWLPEGGSTGGVASAQKRGQALLSVVA